MTSSIGFTLRHAPYGNHHAHEALDAIMACSAYGHPIHVFFMHDGVFCLNEHQNTSAFTFKNITKQLSAFSLYGIEHVFACEQSLKTRNIHRNQIASEVQVLPITALQKALAQQKHLLSF